MTDGKKTELVLDLGRKLPVCLRKYEPGNPECDGFANGRTPESRMPCVCRDRCVALQRLVRVQGYKARDMLKLRKVRDPDGRRRVYAFAIGDSEEFQRSLIRAIDRYGIRNGRITIRHPDEGDEDDAPHRPRKIKNRSDESKQKSVRALVRARTFATKALKEKAREDLTATRGLLAWFVSRLQRTMRRYYSRSGPKKFAFAEDQASASVGELFLVDRVKSSRYVTLYVKTVRRGPNGRKHRSRRPIACIVFAVRTHSLQFRFPFDRETLESLLPAQALAKVGPEEFSEGRFRSRTCMVGKEGASLAAEAIARALHRGLIRRPKTSEA